jgi:hypothetical protein
VAWKLYKKYEKSQDSRAYLSAPDLWEGTMTEAAARRIAEKRRRAAA